MTILESCCVTNLLGQVANVYENSARSNLQTNYTYLTDKLTSVTYTDGMPNSSYTYNANGQLTQSSNSSATNNYLTFDGDGRVLTSDVVTGGVTYPFIYTYDLAGDLTQETYPSGGQVNYTYDLAMRPLTVNGVSAGVTTKYVPQRHHRIRRRSQRSAEGNSRSAHPGRNLTKIRNEKSEKSGQRIQSLLCPIRG
jgi:YD repeat-containing protein